MTTAAKKTGHYSIDDVINRSRKADIGKVDVSTSRKQVSVGFEVDQETGETEFFLQLGKTSDPQYTDKKLYFTNYSWTQLWQGLLDYSTHAVSVAKIPEYLIRKIAIERVNRMIDWTFEAKLFRNHEFMSSNGTDGKVFLRGYSSSMSASLPTTTLLQALSLVPGGQELFSKGMPTFPDHLFYGRFVGPDNAGSDIEYGLCVSNSEVMATKGAIDATISLPEHGVTFITQSFGNHTYALNKNHKEPSLVIEDLTKAMKKLSDVWEDTEKSYKQAAKAIVTKRDSVFTKLRGRYGLTKGLASAIQSTLDRGVRNNDFEQTRLGVAIAVAKVARRRSNESRFKLETLAGTILQTKAF